ncbi:hypothetical protein LZ32DRAFT_623084, partial [Colletotrichum eremochloae]
GLKYTLNISKIKRHKLVLILSINKIVLVKRGKDIYYRLVKKGLISFKVLILILVLKGCYRLLFTYLYYINVKAKLNSIRLYKVGLIYPYLKVIVLEDTPLAKAKAKARAKAKAKAKAKAIRVISPYLKLP